VVNHRPDALCWFRGRQESGAHRALLARHCQAPAGPLSQLPLVTEEQSRSSRDPQVVVVGFPRPPRSPPLWWKSTALAAAEDGFVPASPALNCWPLLGAGPIQLSGLPAPWALPKVWPRPTKATVFHRVHRPCGKVSRTSRPKPIPVRARHWGLPGSHRFKPICTAARGFSQARVRAVGVHHPSSWFRCPVDVFLRLQICDVSAQPRSRRWGNPSTRGQTVAREHDQISPKDEAVAVTSV